MTPANVLFPYRGRFHDHDGVRQHFLDEGPRDAPPVVMVHGNPTWSFAYRRLVEELRGTHRVIVPDHVGCGRSDKPPKGEYDYSFARRVDDLSALLEAEDVTDGVTLIVHDWGGAIGLTWAARDVSRIARLVVLNTAAFPMLPNASLRWEIAACRAPLIGGLITRGLNGFVRTASRRCVVTPLVPEVRAMLESPYDSWANRVAIHEFVRTIPLRPGDPAHDVITATGESLARYADRPVLICWGGQDFVFDDRYLAEFRRRLPHAAVHRFEDAGHYVLEDKGDQVAALVRAFVDGSA